MTETRYNAHNFVAADARPQDLPRADLVRRADVVHTVDRMISGYFDQQRAALAAVQEDTSRGGYLSNADQVAERRKTSRLYLSFYVIVVALVAGGLVLLAHGAGYIDAGGSFATWLALTGGVALLLGWRRHGDEFAHSPEGIARHLADWHGSVAQYEAETRRKSIRWEYQAEATRQQAQAEAAAEARRQAELRIVEIEARRRAAEAQREALNRNPHEGRFNVVIQAETPPTVQEAPGGAIDEAGEPFDLAEAQNGAAWPAALMQWVASLYEDGATAGNGVIKGQTPWAARSPWVDADKTNARRVCCELRPKLIEPSAGGRWRLRIEQFESPDLALQLLSQRLA